MKHKEVRLYVEGGGKSNDLRTKCRQGFTEFITKAGLKNRPRVVACGSRRDAYDSFCTAVATGTEAILLVDSEDSVAIVTQAYQPWVHLKRQEGDNWNKPSASHDDDCHLMVQVMESWFLADRTCLEVYFGSDFNSSKLPASARELESIEKSEVYRTLKEATDKCETKSRYDKGRHSFELLARIDALKIVAASPWAKRFIDELIRRLDDMP